MTPVLLYGSVEDACLHDSGPRHPERPERVAAVFNGIDEAHLSEAVVRAPSREATRAELARVHSPGYLDALFDFVAAGGRELDPDTHVGARSWQAAVMSAGAGLAAIEALDRGEAEAAFVAVRPPGHHATASEAMGFCLLNNAAITAAALADRGERVLIVDWDVHHGNGTQDIFWDDARVLYVSTHQWPSYPGTGRPQEAGGPGAPGLTINLPLPPGATGDVARAAIETVAMPTIEEFSPTWVLISAGFDAHRDDPLADLGWSAGDYDALTRLVSSWAPAPARLIAFLEGGYDLQALGYSAASTIAALAGDSYVPEAPTSGGPGLEMVARSAEIRRQVSPPA